jgi:hypothetical protein
MWDPATDYNFSDILFTVSMVVVYQLTTLDQAAIYNIRPCVQSLF